MTTILLINFSLLLIYTYAGYPLMLWCLQIGRRNSHATQTPGLWPDATLVIPVHNGAAVLPGKLHNLAKVSYPGPLSVLFVLDGCTDSSRSIIEAATDGELKFPIDIYESPQRIGKEAALKNAVSNVNSETLIFSDADAMLQPNTINELVKALCDDKVGVACGQEIHKTSNRLGAGEGQGYFYRYENLIKRMQSTVSSMTYVQGGVFAMKKDLYSFNLKPGCTQDGIIAFHAVLNGKQVRHVPSAVSEEGYDISTAKDFSRRVRTICRAFYSIICQPRIFLPWRTGFYGIHVLSHRILRWFTIPLMATVFFLTAMHANESSIVLAYFVLQLLFYAFAALGYFLEVVERRLKIPYICYYFMYLHIAAFFAITQVMLGRRVVTWQPTAAQE